VTGFSSWCPLGYYLLVNKASWAKYRKNQLICVAVAAEKLYLVELGRKIVSS
jgi:hypothetical protein